MGLGNYGRIQNKRESSSNLAIFLECFSCFFFICYIILTLVLICNPRGLFFIGDLVPLKYYHFPVPLLIIIFHAYLFFACHLVCLTVGTATLVYGSYIMPILIRELRMGRSKYKLKDSLRKPENIRHAYRCLQVLHANVFEVLGLFFVASNASFTIATLFCNFVLIKYWNQLQIFSKLQLLAWTVIFMSFWACVLELGRFLFSRGYKVLSSWKMNVKASTQERKLMQKFLRSCKPIVLSYGKQFVIGRVSVLVFFRGVVRGTFRALLTTKS